MTNEARAPGDGEVEEIVSVLKLLANEARFQLLLDARTPVALCEVRLCREDGTAMSRVAVRKHAAPLIRAGFLVPVSNKRYVVNPRRFAELKVQVDRLAEMAPAEAPLYASAQTLPLAPGALAKDRSQGPHVQIISGPGIGKYYPLKDEARENVDEHGLAWIVGREKGLIRLPFDPYVSPVHAAVWPAGGAFWLRHLAPSEENPTLLNDRQVGRDAVELGNGDTVVVGLTRLRFER